MKTPATPEEIRDLEAISLKRAEVAAARRKDAHQFWEQVLMGVAVVMIIAIVIGGIVLWVHEAQVSNRQATHRDQVVKVECLHQGKSILESTDGVLCVRVAP